MNAINIRIQLIRKGLQLKDLARRSGIDYDRLQKVLHGYRRARPEEVRAIAEALNLPESDIRPSA